MEYLDGETLAQRLEKGALPLDQALTVAIEIADALDKAHRQGMTIDHIRSPLDALNAAAADDSGVFPTVDRRSPNKGDSPRLNGRQPERQPGSLIAMHEPVRDVTRRVFLATAAGSRRCGEHTMSCAAIALVSMCVIVGVTGVLTPVGAAEQENAQSAGVGYWSRAEVFDARGPLFDSQQAPAHQVYGIRIDQAGPAEVHSQDADVIFVLDGSATVVTGGEVIEPRSPRAGETLGSAIRGGERHALGPGDVLIVPAGTPHWFQQVGDNIDILAVKMRETISSTGTPRPASWWSGADLPGSTPLVFDGREDGRGYQVFAVRRDGPGAGELHDAAEDIIFVLSGSARFVTGGSMLEPRSPRPGETLGSGIQGGTVHDLAAGDVVIVPRGTPHWFRDVSDQIEYLALKVVFSDADRDERRN